MGHYFLFLWKICAGLLINGSAGNTLYNRNGLYAQLCVLVNIWHLCLSAPQFCSDLLGFYLTCRQHLLLFSSSSEKFFFFPMEVWQQDFDKKQSVRCTIFESLHCNEIPIYVFLSWELRGLSPNIHIHVPVSKLYIPRTGPHIFLQQNRQIDLRCGNWDCGRAIPFLEIFVSNFRYCFFAVCCRLGGSYKNMSLHAIRGQALGFP